MPSHLLCVLYSGKIWWALNLVISAKMPYFFTLVSFKCDVLGPRPPNVTSPLQCKPSLVVDRIPVVCDFKLREGFVHAILSAHLPILALSRVYLLYFEVRPSL